jgi:hypothetical protein
MNGRRRGEKGRSGEVCRPFSASLVCPLGPAISRQPKWGINDDLVRARPPDLRGIHRGGNEYEREKVEVEEERLKGKNQ